MERMHRMVEPRRFNLSAVAALGEDPARLGEGKIEKAFPLLLQAHAC
jgi:hypothetical protein